jgi:carboxypeptidase Taq
MVRRDTRLTTRYGDGDVESLLSSLHEYGHALYERQIDPVLKRTNLGCGTSMSVHESQSELWENHVARSPAFAEVVAAELGNAGFAVGAAELNEVLVGVEPSAIRVSADPLPRRVCAAGRWGRSRSGSRSTCTATAADSTRSRWLNARPD